MKSSTAIIVISGAIAIATGGSILFHHLAQQTRREVAESNMRLAALQGDVAAGDSLARLDSINANFTSCDLSFHELRGRVRHVTYGEESVDFDREGNWTNPQAYVTRSGNALSFNRDKFGCIIGGVTADAVEGQAVEKVEYTWSGDRVKRIESDGFAGHYRIDCTYDGKQRLTQMSVVSSDEESKSEIVTTFTYSDFDRYGNWTRRTARSAIKTTVNGGYYDEDSGTFISGGEPVLDSSEEEQTRSITYWN